MASEKKLVIAVDGSSAAGAAVGAGLELAKAMGAIVLFVHAASPLAEKVFAEAPDDGASSGLIHARDPVLAEASERAAAAGIASDVKLVAAEGGSAALAADVAGIAAGTEAVMIVTGSRRRSTVAAPFSAASPTT